MRQLRRRIILPVLAAISTDNEASGLPPGYGSTRSSPASFHDGKTVVIAKVNDPAWSFAQLSTLVV